MADNSRKSQNFMQLIKRVHGLVESPDIDKLRQSQDTIGSLFGNAKDVLYREESVEGMSCEWVSVNRLHRTKPVILYCHGGGYSTGSCLYARTLTSKLAEVTSMDVLCFDYRLAPEHPYPAALQDAVKAWDYLMLLGHGADDVILAGDSAGGNLALSLTQYLRKVGRMLPKGIVLLSPWTDLTSSGASVSEKAEVDPVLDKEYLKRMIRAYAGGEDLSDPMISPLFADFDDFPPVLIQVGENEMLLDDSLRLEKALKASGVFVKLDVYPGMWHVFQMTPLKTTREAMDRIAAFLFELCE